LQLIDAFLLLIVISLGWPLISVILGVSLPEKFINTNRNTDEMFMSVDCGEFYQLNILLLYPLIKTDRTILIYIPRELQREKKKLKQKIQLHIVYIDDITDNIKYRQ
jgi:hypothetical protein